MPDLITIKITIVGAETAGKSALLERIVEDTFAESYFSTIGVDFKVTNDCKKLANGKIVNVKIQYWDTAGADRFRLITQSYYSNTKYFIGVIDASEDFDIQSAFIAEELKMIPEEASWVIVLTKSDLVDDADKLTEIVEKTQAFIDAINLKKNTLGLIVTSAKTGDGIENVTNPFFDAEIKLLEQAAAQQPTAYQPQNETNYLNPDPTKNSECYQYLSYLSQRFDGLSNHPSMENDPADRERALSIFQDELSTCGDDLEKYEMLAGFAKPYINRHRHPVLDMRFGKENTSTWNNALQETRKAALCRVKQTGFFTSENLSYWRDRTLFSEHRNNFRLAGAFGRTSAQKEIDGLIKKLNR
jgi:small GTP-binding protein